MRHNIHEDAWTSLLFPAVRMSSTQIGGRASEHRPWHEPAKSLLRRESMISSSLAKLQLVGKLADFVWSRCEPIIIRSRGAAKIASQTSSSACRRPAQIAHKLRATSQETANKRQAACNQQRHHLCCSGQCTAPEVGTADIPSPSRSNATWTYSTIFVDARQSKMINQGYTGRFDCTDRVWRFLPWPEGVDVARITWHLGITAVRSQPCLVRQPSQIF